MDGMKWWKDKLDKALMPRFRKPRPPSIYGTFYERLMAAGIDITILFVALNSTFSTLSKNLYSRLTPEQMASLSYTQDLSLLFYNAVHTGFLALWLTNFICQVVLIGIVLVTFQSWLHTTPGKWVMGLKLTTSDNETFPSTWRLILRYCAYVISCAPLMLGVVWMNFDTQSRTWHDSIAGTRVITTRPEGWYWGKVKQGFFALKAKFKND